MRTVLSKLAIAAAATVGAVSSAQAYVILTISDLTGTTTASVSCNTSNGAGCTSDFSYAPNSNFISFGTLALPATVGGFEVQTTQGFASSGPLGAAIDTSSLLVHRIGGETILKDQLLISLTVLDVFQPTDVVKTLSGSGAQTSGQGITAGDLVETRLAVNANNTASFFPPLNGFNGTDMWAMSCTFAAGPSAQCDATDTGLPGGSQSVVWSDPSTSALGFSMQSQQRFTLGASATLNTVSSAVIGTVPEPMTTALVGVALLGLALTGRRSSAKKA